MVPMHAQTRKEASHEPDRDCVRSTSRRAPERTNPLRLGLRPQPRSNLCRFMVSMHARKRKDAPHEPPVTRCPLTLPSPPMGEGSRRPGEEDARWFMAPMRGHQTVEALHEPPKDWGKTKMGTSIFGLLKSLGKSIGRFMGRCAILESWKLSMNRAPSPRPSPPMGERVSERRVRGWVSVHGTNARSSNPGSSP